MFDTLHEECGVFGIYEPHKTTVAHSVYYALYALQHRGQQSCGIVVNEDGLMRAHRANGLVPEVFQPDVLEKLGEGDIAVGHVRYSVAGQNDISNAQPLLLRHVKGNLAISYNGSLTNAYQLRRQYELDGAIFHTVSDAEVIAYAITRERLTAPSIEVAVERMMNSVQGAYSLVIMSPRKLIAARDPHGFHPLCMGRTQDGAVVFASESCAFDTIGAVYERDVAPGEVVVVSEQGVSSITTHCKGKAKLCVFEFVYFARPDSVIEGCSVQKARINAGRILAKEHPVDADVVIGVPDSGLDAALGYASESGIPYQVGFIKNRYVGRSFIQPSQSQREDAVRVKLNAVKEAVCGKRVVMVDDSIVRGTTSARIVNLLREAGAKEVHMMVSSPMYLYPCYFGTDVDSREKLIAYQLGTVERIRQQIGVDSLGYLSIEGVQKMASDADCEFCIGCFTGNYPAPIPESNLKDKFEEKIRKEGQV